MRLLLDAGHGGQDPGALSLDGNEQEKDYTLAIVLEMESILIHSFPDVEFDLVRRDDTYLTPGSRRRMVGTIKPDAFISVHCNAASTSKAHGAEVVYRDALDEKLARAIQASLVRSLPLRDRGIKTDIGDLRRSLAVLDTPGVPSVIVEVGFITNDDDLLVLGRTHDVALAIIEGVRSWAGL